MGGSAAVLPCCVLCVANCGQPAISASRSIAGAQLVALNTVQAQAAPGQAACWLLLDSAACCPMHLQLALRCLPCRRAGNNILLCSSTKDARGFTVKVGAACELAPGCWLLHILLRVCVQRLSTLPSPASPHVADCRLWPLQDTHKVATDTDIWDSHTHASW